MARVLVVRLSSIGDIVHALPAVAALAGSFPEAEIHWAVEARYACLLERNPFVHRVIRIDTLGWTKRLTAPATLEEMVQTVVELRRAAYDLTVDFQGLVKSAAVAWLSGSRERVGLAEYWLKEPVAGIFYTERVSARHAAHVIEESMALSEHLALTRGARPARSEGFRDRSQWKFPLPRSAEDDTDVEQRLAQLDGQEFIVMNPGGGWTAKLWDPENYAELIRRLEDEFSWNILLTGSPAEEPMIARILERARSQRAFYFRSTLVQLIALLRRASLFLGGDTGPLHLAAAVGTPIVAIYGPTDSVRNGPFSAQDIALSNSDRTDHTRRARKPSHLRGIPVESVLEGIRRRLAIRSKQSHG